MMWAELPELVRVIAALAFIIALMGGLSMLLKHFGLVEGRVVRGKEPRLKVLETLPLDGRRRLCLLQCDEKQHLVILGPNGETVLDSDVKPPKAKTKATKKTKNVKKTK